MTRILKQFSWKGWKISTRYITKYLYIVIILVRTCMMIYCVKDLIKMLMNYLLYT